MESIGVHCILELYGCPVDNLFDGNFVERALQGAVQESGASLLKQVSHRFTPYGVTALGLLAESHISIHTWPENGYAAADIFTCGHTADPVKACRSLVRAFQPARHTLLKLPRGSQVNGEPAGNTGLVGAGAEHGDSESAVACPDSEEGERCREATCAPIYG